MQNAIELIESGKVKRCFRARKKLCFEGAIGHITQHASGKEPLFLEEPDYLYMLHLTKETSKRFKFDVLSFAFMPNHMHLLINFKEANMTLAMKNLFERYAKYFNKKYNRRGHVFCGAYRFALCFDEGYLIAASLYIHFNPVKSDLVENPADYRWSSCSLFLEETSRDSFVDYKFILRILDCDICSSKMKYKELLSKLKKERVQDVLEYPRVWLILKENLLSGDDYLAKKIEKLKTKKRLMYPKDIKARQFLIQQLKARGFSVSEIAQRLKISRQAIYKQKAAI